MNEIHPTALIDERVEMGAGNRILPYTVLLGPLQLGNDNVIGPHVVIGSPGQDTRNPHYDSSESPIKIGSGNIIREFSAIQKPCYRDSTSLGNNIFLMQSVHIPHDAILHDGVVVTPMCVLGGISTIMTHATLGMGASVHQYSIVGGYSIVATGAAVTKNVKPFSRYIPGKPLSVNEYAIKKYGFESVADEIKAFVLNSETPCDANLRTVIDEYRRLHEESGRGEY